MDPYQKTFATWNKVAPLYQEKFMDVSLYQDSYDRFCQLIDKPHAAIFEIGCGPGNITKYLISQRPDFRIDAIDVAPGMIELARANNPSVHYKVMDCRNIVASEAKYDGIIAGFCMPYLSKEDNSRFIKDCSALLHPGGVFYFSTIKGDYNRSGYIAGSTGDECYVYFYEEEYLLQELQRNNFSLIALAFREHGKNDGTGFTDMIFITRKQF